MLGPVWILQRQLGLRVHVALQCSASWHEVSAMVQVLWMGPVEAPREAALTLQRGQLGMQGTVHTQAQCLQMDDPAAAPQAPKQSISPKAVSTASSRHYLLSAAVDSLASHLKRPWSSR